MPTVPLPVLFGTAQERASEIEPTFISTSVEQIDRGRVAFIIDGVSVTFLLGGEIQATRTPLVETGSHHPADVVRVNWSACIHRVGDTTLFLFCLFLRCSF